MNAESLDLWLKIIVSALSVGAITFSWLTSRSAANTKQLQTLHERDEQQEKRIQRLESDIAHLPDKETVHRIELSVEQMRGDIHGMREGFKAVERTAVRIDEYFMDRAKHEGARP